MKSFLFRTFRAVALLAMLGSPAAAEPGLNSIYGVSPGMSVSGLEAAMNSAGLVRKTNGCFSYCKEFEEIGYWTGQHNVPFMREYKFLLPDNDSRISVTVYAVQSAGDWIVGRILRNEIFREGPRPYDAIYKDVLTRAGVDYPTCWAHDQSSRLGFLFGADGKMWNDVQERPCTDPSFDADAEVQTIAERIATGEHPARQIVLTMHRHWEPEMVKDAEIDLIDHRVIGESFAATWAQFMAENPPAPAQTKLGDF